MEAISPMMAGPAAPDGTDHGRETSRWSQGMLVTACELFRQPSCGAGQVIL